MLHFKKFEFLKIELCALCEMFSIIFAKHCKILSPPTSQLEQYFAHANYSSKDFLDLQKNFV